MNQVPSSKDSKSQIFALTDSEKRVQGGITAFIVETKWPGFRAGRPERKMGIRGSHTTNLFFENLHVRSTMP